MPNVLHGHSNGRCSHACHSSHPTPARWSPCPGYVGHPYGKQGSLSRSDVVGRRSERESYDRNACFGMDNLSSQDSDAVPSPWITLIYWENERELEVGSHAFEEYSRPRTYHLQVKKV